LKQSDVLALGVILFWSHVQ